MRQETYRFAVDEATKELHGIVEQFEALRSRKEQIEAVVEALRPFIGLHAETPNSIPAIEASAPIVEFVAPIIEEPSPEPQFSFIQNTKPNKKKTSTTKT